MKNEKNNKNSHQKKFVCVCMYKMVDISVETWNKVKVYVINIHENDNTNKTILQLLCISDIKKVGVIKIFMT